MRILLILPAGASVRVTRENPAVPKRNMLRFSVLPLTTVAGLTPPEHDVRIVDENVEALDYDTPADLVGITFMTALAPRAYEIARELKRRGRTVVAGGFHPTLCPNEAKNYFDAIVLGDAEGAWPQLLADYAAGRLQPIYRGGQHPGHPPRRDLLHPARKHYATIHAVQTGRGCRHTCRYCSVTAFHRQQYCRRDIRDILDELRSVPRDFIFVDDNIIASRDHAAALFAAMIPMRKRWVAQCPIAVADDPELLRLMRQAGCRGLFIGLETTNPNNLNVMDKGFNDSRRYPESIRTIRRHGIGIAAGIMVGLDADDPTVFERTLDFLEANDIDAVQVNILTPLPGTPLYEQMQKHGRITDPDWGHYDFRHVVFEPKQMTAAQLQAGADWLYAEFYRLDRIVVRFAGTLLTCGWVPAWLGLKLNLTYRYDNRRECITGHNPAPEIRPQRGTLSRLDEFFRVN